MEDKATWDRLAEGLKTHWNAAPSYWWHPTFPAVRDDVFAFRAPKLREAAMVGRIKTILRGAGYFDVWCIQENAVGRVPTNSLDLSYEYGVGKYFTSDDFAWIIYVAPYATISIGGTLLQALKESWDSWARAEKRHVVPSEDNLSDLFLPADDALKDKQWGEAFGYVDFILQHAQAVQSRAAWKRALGALWWSTHHAMANSELAHAAARASSDPDDADALRRLAWAYVEESGGTSQAMTILTKGLSVHAGDERLSREVGRVLLRAASELRPCMREALRLLREMGFQRAGGLFMRLHPAYDETFQIAWMFLLDLMSAEELSAWLQQRPEAFEIIAATSLSSASVNPTDPAGLRSSLYCWTLDEHLDRTGQSYGSAECVCATVSDRDLGSHELSEGHFVEFEAPPEFAPEASVLSVRCCPWCHTTFLYELPAVIGNVEEKWRRLEREELRQILVDGRWPAPEAQREL